MVVFRKISMRSPRNPGYLVQMRLPDGFAQFREVDDFAAIAVEIMNHRAPFASLPLCAAAFVAIQLALAGAESEQERNRGISMLQAIRAIRLPHKQPIICREALQLLREVEPLFEYPTGFRHA